MEEEYIFTKNIEEVWGITTKRNWKFSLIKVNKRERSKRLRNSDKRERISVQKIVIVI